MKPIITFSLLFTLLLFSCSRGPASGDRSVDVLIIGGGASGSMAGLQSARQGASTIIAEDGPWLGGMLTSAGVSAIDGNHNLHSGLWNEFRQKLFDHYGGPDSVNTGWVSHVLFEPIIGADIIRQMAFEQENLEVRFEADVQNIEQTDDGWHVSFVSEERGAFTIDASVLIDGTELGDVAKKVGVPYDVGMDSRHDTGEEIAPEEANDIVQDMTYVAILEDYGEDADMTIPRPENYDPEPFYCTCEGICDSDTIDRKLWPCDEMIEYGKLPNDKYMINWPIFGNDYYLNVIEMSPQEREEAYEKAKWFTRCYVYYMQTELGFENLGLAKGEFPTEDGFPLIPYHRESRRIHGKVRFTVNDLARPFEQETALYRTGIAVGDYPIDHHHAAYPDQSKVPDLHFYPVPSYSLPLGTLIPEEQEDLIVAEKSISVTNIVNGTTRLQPVCILNGQAAGSLAALATEKGVTPAEVPVRDVQNQLLDAGAYIRPYSDVSPDDSYWVDVQKTGATGLIKGEGKNVGWENHTLFHPDSVMVSSALEEGLTDLPGDFSVTFDEEIVSLQEGVDVALDLATHFDNGNGDEEAEELLEELWRLHGFGEPDPEAAVTRAQMAVLLNSIARPFDMVEVDLKGRFKQ
ncbi:MAG: FAD-dependent oxidoreductase [Bacteroidota bacterium]